MTVPIYTASEVDSRIASIPSGSSRSYAIPGWADFFGPLPGAGYTQVMPSTWSWLTGATANTRLFPFSMGTPRFEWAIWRAVWQCRGATSLALFKIVPDGSRPEEHTGIQMNFRPEHLGHPDNTAIDVSAVLNAMVDARQDWQLGMKIYGDNVGPMTMFASRLEYAWRI